MSELLGIARLAVWPSLRSSALLLADERLVDVGDDSTASDGGLDQSVQLLVSPDGELEMSGGDSLHLQVLTGVAGQLEDLSREVLQDGGAVDGSGGSNTATAEGPGLQMTMDPIIGCLKKKGPLSNPL